MKNKSHVYSTTAAPLQIEMYDSFTAEIDGVVVPARAGSQDVPTISSDGIRYVSFSTTIVNRLNIISIASYPFASLLGLNTLS